MPIFKSYHFTYQAMAGLEFRFMECWAISAGYRWFDAGKFKGPKYVRDENGIALEAIPGGSDFGHKYFSNSSIFSRKSEPGR